MVRELNKITLSYGTQQHSVQLEREKTFQNENIIGEVRLKFGNKLLNEINDGHIYGTYNV